MEAGERSSRSDLNDQDAVCLVRVVRERGPDYFMLL